MGKIIIKFFDTPQLAAGVVHFYITQKPLSSTCEGAGASVFKVKKGSPSKATL
jgi:hypothetical protein